MPIKEQPKGPDLNSFREMMQGAIAEFNQKSNALTQAYQKLKKEIARVNRELEQKNQELSQTNKALDQASAFLNNIFQSMSGGLLVVDSEGVILKTNAGLDALFSEKTSAWEGKSLKEVPIPGAVKEAVSTARKTRGKPYEGALRITVGGAERWIEVTGTIVDNTEGRELLLLMRDVSEMKDLRQQLIQKESLAGLGRLAVTVAHEIRNPLGGIEGFAGLLKRDLAGNVDHTKLLDKIIHGVRNLNDFITQLLTFAKILQVHPNNMDLETIVEKAMLYSGSDTLHAPESSLHMQKDFTGTVALCSDPDLIGQMLLNLLLNAIDVVCSDGRVIIRVREYPDGPDKARKGAIHSIQSIHFDGARRHVLLSVLDSGPGIEADIAEQLFTPFFTTKATGTGIGLSMVHKIIEILEGRLDVYTESELGGAEFQIVLPDLLKKEIEGHKSYDD